jgi:hypothetical protein
MATIQQATIAFTSSSQNRVKVTFQVKFAGTEIRGAVSPSWLARYGGLLPPGLGALFRYSASILFRVIRIVPQPYVVGTPPPPLPDPVTLQSSSVLVPLPTSGSTTSRAVFFEFALGVDDPLTFDHLHAEVRLFRRSVLGPNLPSALTFPVNTKITNDLVLTASDLANPQPDGTTIS